MLLDLFNDVVLDYVGTSVYYYGKVKVSGLAYMLQLRTNVLLTFASSANIDLAKI